MGPSESSSLASRQSTTGFRARLRRTPGGGLFLRGLVFVVGLLFVLLGIALIALPGPLTIPPILLGVWVWSTEFAWADRLLDRARRSAEEAWHKARNRPLLTGLVTVSGLVAFGVGVWLVLRFELLERARELVGLG